MNKDGKDDNVLKEFNRKWKHIIFAVGSIKKQSIYFFQEMKLNGLAKSLLLKQLVGKSAKSNEKLFRFMVRNLIKS